MKTLIKLYKEAKKYWKYIAFSTVSLLIITGANLIAPGLMQRLVGILETGAGNPNLVTDIIKLAICLAVVYLVQSVSRYFNSYYSHVAAWNFVSQMRVKIYNHLQKLSLSYYADKQTGQLMSRIVHDTNHFEHLIAHAIPDLVSALLTFAGVTTIIFLNNWKLALLTCIPLPFLALATPILHRIRGEHRKAQKHVAELNATLQDNISGIKEIQVFNQQENERSHIEGLSKNHAKAVIKALWYSAFFHPALSFFTSLGNVIVIGFGGYFALTGEMSISEITGFLMYLSMFYTPISSFARIFEDMQQGIVGAERMFEILDTNPDIQDKEGAIDIGATKGELEFKNVSFSYREDIPVLKNLSFKLEPKKMYAVVGATGVGKSTLASLIPRFYDPTEGEILLDGNNTKDITLTSLRNNISMVLQDVFLFHGTIKENIVFGSKDATEEEIVAAAKTACIYDFIMSLPETWDTVVGERGMRLSGGQKQRISIARSILSKSSVLVLDEATSAVDTETETQIKMAINTLVGSRTMLVIAHRLSTVKAADSIIVLEEGKIAEMGTHDELINKNGIYKKLVDLQSIKD